MGARPNHQRHLTGALCGGQILSSPGGLETSQWVGWCIGPSGRFFIFWTFFVWILPRSSAHVCALCAFACWVSDLRGCSCFPSLCHLCPPLLLSASAATWPLHSFFFCGLCAVVLLLMLAFSHQCGPSHQEVFSTWYTMVCWIFVVGKCRFLDACGAGCVFLSKFLYQNK